MAEKEKEEEACVETKLDAYVGFRHLKLQV
jgi:hypothetical protein